MYVKRVVLSVLLFISFGVVFAHSAPPSGGYLPGAEIDPDCMPGTSDCFVKNVDAKKDVLYFLSRSDAEDPNIGVTNDIKYISIGQFSYVYDSNGNALATGDGRTWSPSGFVFPDHFAENSIPGSTDMGDAINKAIKYSTDVYFTKNEYATNQPIISNKFFTRFRNNTKITCLHTIGPCIHFRKSYYNISGFIVEGGSARRSADYSVFNSGIITGDFDWQNPTTDRQSGGAFGVIEQNAIRFHSGDGIYALGSGLTVANNSLNNNGGHGFHVDSGASIGIIGRDIGYPGWSEVTYNKITGNEGHGVAVGHPSTSGFNGEVYRYSITNNDVSENATNSSILFEDYEWYLVGAQIQTSLNAVNESMYVAGRNHKHHNNRFVSLPDNIAPVKIGNLSTYPSKDIEFSGSRVVNPIDKLDPFFDIDDSIVPSQGIVVEQVDNSNITALVSEDDRIRLSKYEFKGDLDLLDTFSISNYNNVGIGTRNPDALLTVDNGTTIGRYEVTGWTHSSDSRLKKEITSLSSSESLTRVLQLNPVEYVFKNDKQEVKQIGFIAQEVEGIFPETVTTGQNGYKALAYGNLVAPLVKALQRLYSIVIEENDIQNNEIDILNAKNKELEHQVKELRIILKDVASELEVIKELSQ